MLGLTRGVCAGLSCLPSQTAPENAPFFTAVFRHIGLLGRKGCVRTALECCKARTEQTHMHACTTHCPHTRLTRMPCPCSPTSTQMLLCLDASDPVGVLQCIDYYALRAAEGAWLSRFGHTFRGDGALPTLPGWAFSLAMAAWAEEADARAGGSSADAAASVDAGAPRADEALRDALLLHPAVLPRLVERLTAGNAVSLDAEWRATLAAPLFANASCGGSASLEHLVDIFVERHNSLWRPAGVLVRVWRMWRSHRRSSLCAVLTRRYCLRVCSSYRRG